MSEQPVRKRGFLLNLAAEGVAPVVVGCAGALAGGPIGGMAGVVVGEVVERAINVFGKHIVERWLGWLRGQPRSVQMTALSELAELSAARARAEAVAAVDALAPDATPEDRAVAVEYLSAIPRAVARSLVLDQVTGGLTLPPQQLADDPHILLQLLPADVPPYPPGSALPDSPYRLGELVGTGGFGAVYRATATSLQHLTFALKFCLDRSMVAMLSRERDNLERLIQASQGRWSERVVRLYGYNLDHPTPFLVYEYVPGGDLATLLANLKQQTGRGPAADEVLGLVRQVAEGLAFAHQLGLVHRDLKPANVLVSGDAVKLADFGIGSVVAGHAAQHSRIGGTLVDQLTSAEQVSLFRGAGTPLYMSPEQRRGEPPDPRHDLYSFGVLWYQLLVGDVSRELHPGWAKELTVKHDVPTPHIALIERCVGWFDDRPKHAGELLNLLTPAPAAATEQPRTAPKPVTDEEVRATRQRFRNLVLELNVLLADHHDYEREERRGRTVLMLDVVVGAIVAVLVAWVVAASFGTWVLGWILGVGVGVGAGWLMLRGRHWQAVAWREKVLASIDRLARDHPDEVQSWGGKKALANVEVLRELIAAVEADAPRPTVS